MRARQLGWKVGELGQAPGWQVHRTDSPQFQQLCWRYQRQSKHLQQRQLGEGEARSSRSLHSSWYALGLAGDLSRPSVASFSMACSKDEP